jgi:hypothetical protein
MKGLSRVEIENVISQMEEDAKSGHAPSPESGVIEVAGEVSAENFGTFEAVGECVMTATDGGSAVLLDAGSSVVAAVRVGNAIYSGRARQATAEPETHLLYLSAADLEATYSIVFGKTVGGEPPDAPRGLEEAVGRIRTLLEWKTVEDALLGGMPSGSVLAFDGALWAGIKGIGPMLSRIVDKACRDNVMLCGISKRSMLTRGSKPLIPLIQMAGDRALPDTAWFYPVLISGYGEKLFGLVNVAKLHPRSRYAFRTDLSLPKGADAGRVLGMLSSFSNDPAYIGYPYPLARVHNDVAFSGSEVEDLRNMLRSEALRRGMDPKEWQLTFQDFHEVLDKGR